MTPLPPVPPLPPPPVPAKLSPWPWVVLGCGLLSFLFVVLVAGAVSFIIWHRAGALQATVSQSSSTAVQSAPASLLKPLPDADVLARRMKWDQDVYLKVRDDALAGYAYLHPHAAHYDDEAHAALRLLAYLSVWDDYYGEGLWQQYEAHEHHLYNEGAKFTVWTGMLDVHTFEGSHSSNEESAATVTAEALDFQTTHYPALFKFLICKSLIHELIVAKSAGDIAAGPGTSYDKIPKLIELATETYAELLREHLSNAMLFDLGNALLSAAKGDEPSLIAVSTGLDRAFQDEGGNDPLGQVLKGSFYIDDAWCARGSGWANSVSSQSWELFGERLATANTILTKVYAEHPDQAGTPYEMMTVVLGQQLPRDQMELWFQRGLKLNANTFPIYMSKRYYLLPRWYGSDAEVWQFGLDCAQSDDWAAKTPAILLKAIEDAASRDPGIYARPEIWGPVEKTFRAYLDHYPAASIYRSRFLKCAVDGGHWDVAAEQLKILGGDWDRSEFEGNEYAQIQQVIRAHVGTGK